MWPVEERTCVDHDQQFHEAIIDVARCCGLKNEDVLVPDGLAHCDTGLLVGVIQAHGLCDFDAQPALGAMAVSIFSGANHECPSSPQAINKTAEAGKRALTDRFATSWASKGWEFPLSSLISFDMVDMVEDFEARLL